MSGATGIADHGLESGVCICRSGSSEIWRQSNFYLSPFRFCCRVCWVHHVTGMWVYPFLEHIGPGARILFFGSTTILMNFLYLLGEVLNSYIWDTQRSKYCSGGHKTKELLQRQMENSTVTLSAMRLILPKVEDTRSQLAAIPYVNPCNRGGLANGL